MHTLYHCNYVAQLVLQVYTYYCKVIDIVYLFLIQTLIEQKKRFFKFPANNGGHYFVIPRVNNKISVGS